jgi:SHS2 domain-containing protein
VSWRPIEHTADLGIEVEAASREELFADAARGLYETVLELAPAPPLTSGEVELSAPALDLLLVAWLEELLFRLDAHYEVWLRCSVTLDESTSGWALRAELAGGPLDPRRDAFKVQVKAITYHGLEVARHEAGWRARVLFDI